MLIKIEKLKDFILLKEKGIDERTTGHKKSNRWNKWTILCITKNCHKNAIKLYNERDIIFNKFVKQAIYSGDVEKDVYYRSEKSVPEFEENIAERAKMRR